MCPTVIVARFGMDLSSLEMRQIKISFFFISFCYRFSVETHNCQTIFFLQVWYQSALSVSCFSLPSCRCNKSENATVHKLKHLFYTTGHATNCCRSCMCTDCHWLLGMAKQGWWCSVHPSSVRTKTLSPKAFHSRMPSLPWFSSLTCNYTPKAILKMLQMSKYPEVFTLEASNNSLAELRRSDEQVQSCHGIATFVLLLTSDVDAFRLESSGRRFRDRFLNRMALCINNI